MKADGAKSKWFGMFLNCCRANRGYPFPEIHPRGNSFVMQACTVDALAYDGLPGTNGFFTTHLLEVLRSQDSSLSLEELSSRVRRESNARQTFTCNASGFCETHPFSLE